MLLITMVNNDAAQSITSGLSLARWGQGTGTCLAILQHNLTSHCMSFCFLARFSSNLFLLYFIKYQFVTGSNFQKNDRSPHSAWEAQAHNSTPHAHPFGPS